jgi:hypothetical protein
VDGEGGCEVMNEWIERVGVCQIDTLYGRYTALSKCIVAAALFRPANGPHA